MDSISLLVAPTDFDPKELATTFKISGTENGIRTLGIPFALNIATLAPKVKVAFFTIQGQDLTQNLADGVWDLAIMGAEQLGDSLHFEPLIFERYLCAVRHDHPVLAEPWDIDTFCALEFVITAYHGGHFTGATDDALAQLGKTRTVKFSVGHFSLLPDLLKKQRFGDRYPCSFFTAMP